MDLVLQAPPAAFGSFTVQEIHADRREGLNAAVGVVWHFFVYEMFMHNKCKENTNISENMNAYPVNVYINR
jgi:hypothetical protein